MGEKYSEISMLFWLSQAYLGMRTAVLAAFRESGHTISTEQHALLDDLWRYGSSTQSEIARRTARDAPAVSRLIGALEKAGYVERTSIDRRTNRVSLTVEGRALHDQLAPIFAKIMDESLGSFSESEKQAAREILKALARNYSQN